MRHHFHCCHTHGATQCGNHHRLARQRPNSDHAHRCQDLPQVYLPHNEHYHQLGATPCSSPHRQQSEIPRHLQPRQCQCETRLNPGHRLSSLQIPSRSNSLRQNTWLELALPPMHQFYVPYGCSLCSCLLVWIPKGNCGHVRLVDPVWRVQQWPSLGRGVNHAAWTQKPRDDPKTKPSDCSGLIAPAPARHVSMMTLRSHI
mmetsp:Transcript_52657/g.104568  ORF Transcript_52657/g.104568 Transcript_52657/m.104568 type:complete len:201 (+) Transcript_52657:1239-1841(+)